jgi:hypothetical protein
MNNAVHPMVVEYIQLRPDHLSSPAPKHEEPFSSPRSWHMLSDSLKEFGDRLSEQALEVLAFGCVTPSHAGQFKAFFRQTKSAYRLSEVLKGEAGWPAKPEERDILYFLAQSFRAQLLKELPERQNALTEKQKEFTHRAKGLIKELAAISLEIAQTVVSEAETGEKLVAWFMVEIVRYIPRLAEKRHEK